MGSRRVRSQQRECGLCLDTAVNHTEPRRQVTVHVDERRRKAKSARGDIDALNGHNPPRDRIRAVVAAVYDVKEWLASATPDASQAWCLSVPGRRRLQASRTHSTVSALRGSRLRRSNRTGVNRSVHGGQCCIDRNDQHWQQGRAMFRSPLAIAARIAPQPSGGLPNLAVSSP